MEFEFYYTPYMWALPAALEISRHNSFIQFLCFTVRIGPGY